MTDVLFDEIHAECEPLGDPERDKSQCLYAKVFECGSDQCPILRQFRGRRPADMILERTNLRKQYEEEMHGHV